MKKSENKRHNQKKIIWNERRNVIDYLIQVV